MLRGGEEGDGRGEERRERGGERGEGGGRRDVKGERERCREGLIPQLPELVHPSALVVLSP